MMRWLRLAHMHATRRLGMQRALRHMLLQHLSAAWYALRTNAATMGHIERTLRTFFKPPLLRPVFPLARQRARVARLAHGGAACAQPTAWAGRGERVGPMG